MDINQITGAVKNATDFEAKKQGWSSWMEKPENRAFMLQTGIALLQGPAPGQGTLGSIGTAIGEGAAARDRNLQSQNEQRVQAVELKQKQTQSDRESQRLAMDKQSMDLDQQKFQEDKKNSESLRNYRTQMGLSSILKSNKTKGPKSADEVWKTVQDKMIKDNAALGQSVSAEDLMAAKKAFFDSWAMAEQTGGSPGAAPVGEVWDIDPQTGMPVLVGG